MRQRPPDWSEFGDEPDPTAALHAGDLPAALSGFATREMLDYRVDGRCHSDGWICGFGVVQWLMGDKYGAAAVWARACDEAFRGKFRYSGMGTFQSGLLLWFASVWLKDDDWHSEAEALLEKLLHKRRPVMGATYPALLARLLRREADLSDVEARQSDVALLREREHTQALFYAGVRAFEDGDVAATAKLWERMGTPKNSLVELEYYLLTHERGRLSERG
jgi:hypothetical protein